MKGTTLNQFLKQLTKTERAELALEIEGSSQYLDRLAATELKGSRKLAHKIFISQFNSSLVKQLQFSEEGYISHRRSFN